MRTKSLGKYLLNILFVFAGGTAMGFLISGLVRNTITFPQFIAGCSLVALMVVVREICKMNRKES